MDQATKEKTRVLIAWYGLWTALAEENLSRIITGRTVSPRNAETQGAAQGHCYRLALQLEGEGY